MEKNDIRKDPSPPGPGAAAAYAAQVSGDGAHCGRRPARILNCLMEQGEMSQRELADACMFDVTTLSRTLDKMEKAGMVTRKVNPASRRAHLIALTPEGKEKAGRVQEQFAWLDQVLWGDIEEKEMESLYRTLEKIEENVKKEK